MEGRRNSGSKPTKLESKQLVTHLPDEVVYLEHEKSLPHQKTFQGVLMFLDISGFTALSERYSTSGKHGTDQLTKTLSGYLGALVQEVLSFDGDILKFAGDAILTLWKVDSFLQMKNTVVHVIKCGMSIQEKYGEWTTNVGVKLHVKIGIAAGEVSMTYVGNEDYCHYVTLGRAVAAVNVAESFCKSGDVVVSPTAWCHVSCLDIEHRVLQDQKHRKITDDLETHDASDYPVKRTLSVSGSCAKILGGLGGGSKDSNFPKKLSTTNAGYRNYVKLMSTYMKLIPNTRAFYRRALTANYCGDLRFSRQKVGLHQFQGMMQNICKEAGCEGYFTGHSGKVSPEGDFSLLIPLLLLVVLLFKNVQPLSSGQPVSSAQSSGPSPLSSTPGLVPQSSGQSSSSHPTVLSGQSVPSEPGPSDTQGSQENIVSDPEAGCPCNAPTAVGQRTSYPDDQVNRMQSLTSHGRALRVRRAVIETFTDFTNVKLRLYITAPVLRKLYDHQPLEYLSEMRQVTIVFINLVLQETTKVQRCLLLQKAFEIIHATVTKGQGCMNKIFMFDKGCTFLAIFGLPGFKHERDCAHALQCAKQMHHELCEFPLILRASIGVTTGSTFCGVVGHNHRHEYTVIGRKVNMAARLMMYYPGKVTCDNDTFHHSKLHKGHFIVLEMKELKGLQNVGIIREYSGKESDEEGPTPAVKMQEYEYPLIGRDREVDLFMKELSMIRNNPSQGTQRQLIVFEGEAGIGKTRLLDAVVNKAMEKNIRVIATVLSMHDSKTPYFVVKSLLMDLLQLNYDLNHQERESSLYKMFKDPFILENLSMLNDVLHLQLPQNEKYVEYDSKKKIQIFHELLLRIVQTVCAKIGFVIFAVDDAHFMDPESWEFVEDLGHNMNSLVVMAIRTSTSTPWCSTAEKVMKHDTTLVMSLQGLQATCLSGLACQMLDVVDIPQRLESILQDKSNGVPSWCEQLLKEMFYDEVILIVPESDRHKYAGAGDRSAVASACNPKFVLQQNSNPSFLTCDDEQMPIIYFKGCQSPLSNLYMAPICWRARTYKSTEHAYQFEKLMFHNVIEANKVLEMCDGYKAKALAEELLPTQSKEWHTRKLMVMYSLLVAKFYACPAYKVALMDQSILVEATRDQFWGSGNNGEGHNMLGCLHHKVKRNWQAVLIAGDSNARLMHVYLVSECRHQTIPVSVTNICLPGASVGRLRKRLENVDVSQFSTVFLIIGSNDLYSKAGRKLTGAKEIICNLNRFMNELACRAEIHIVLNPLLPRHARDNGPTLSTQHYEVHNKRCLYINRHVTRCKKQPEFWKRTKANSFYLQQDGIHLNGMGRRLLARKWAAEIQQED